MPEGVQGWDRYAYVNNNPLKYTDPSGHWIESLFDIASIGYDIYDISTNGLNWVSGLSLAADIASLTLPGVAGGGVIVRAVTHADDVVDAAKATNRIVSISDEAIAFGKKLIDNLPEQMHHLASNVNQKWSPIFEETIKKYGDLNGLWNQVNIPHKYKHPTEYHTWIADVLKQIDQVAQGDNEVYQQLFKKYVVEVVKENPWILKKSWWNEYGKEFWKWWDEVVINGL